VGRKYVTKIEKYLAGIVFGRLTSPRDKKGLCREEKHKKKREYPEGGEIEAKVTCPDNLGNRGGKVSSIHRIGGHFVLLKKEGAPGLERETRVKKRGRR